VKHTWSYVATTSDEANAAEGLFQQPAGKLLRHAVQCDSSCCGAGYVGSRSTCRCRVGNL